MGKKPKDMKMKGVSFNISDPFQLQLWNWCNEQTNFSGLTKRLLAREMEGVVVVKHQKQEEDYDRASAVSSMT